MSRGPYRDSGLTGRKIIADTYGAYAHHGGGAFLRKDCTKVDHMDIWGEWMLNCRGKLDKADELKATYKNSEK